MTTKDCQLDRLGRGLQPMRKRLLPAIAVLIVATVSTSLAAAAGLEDGDDGHGRAVTAHTQSGSGVICPTRRRKRPSVCRT